MNRAVVMNQVGGPEVLEYRSMDVDAPGRGEVKIAHSAIGLNYIDVYHRTGLYPVPAFPAIIGMEGAGVVEELGPGVDELKAGDRVAYAMVLGAYAEHRLIPAERLVKLPDNIGFEQAAGMMLQGMTAQYLVRRTYRVQPGDAVLVHAAAGGVGLISCQWLRHLGATVIGTVGSEKKAALAREHGCHHTVNYRDENFVDRVRELTDGEGVAVVYDSIGRDTFMGSLECLKKLGMMVSFGNTSGPVPPFEPALLAQKGSLFFTRPTINDYIAATRDLRQTAEELFDVVGSGAVRIEVNQRYPLSDTAQAHRDLEARTTTGSSIILP